MCQVTPLPNTNASIEKLYALSFPSNKSWLIPPKAFERSINKAQTESSLSKTYFPSFLAFLQDNVKCHVCF